MQLNNVVKTRLSAYVWDGLVKFNELVEIHDMPGKYDLPKQGHRIAKPEDYLCYFVQLSHLMILCFVTTNVI